MYASLQKKQADKKTSPTHIKKQENDTICNPNHQFYNTYTQMPIQMQINPFVKNEQRFYNYQPENQVDKKEPKTQKTMLKSNNTGIPTQIKTEFEKKSGFSFDDVRVHYNSEKPSYIHALAYTQGNHVHIGPGQEKHLKHELGHVIQQKAGIVKPTEYKQGLYFNKNPYLEKSADLYNNHNSNYNQPITNNFNSPVIQLQEENSTFDINKLKLLVKKLIDYKKSTPEWSSGLFSGWPSNDLTEEDTLTYAEKIQTLFEDIYQIDLRFLSATTISFEEDTKPGKLNATNTLTNEEIEKIKSRTKPTNKETSQTTTTSEDSNNPVSNKIEEEQKYRIILDEKLEYARKMSDELTQNISHINNLIGKLKDNPEHDSKDELDTLNSSLKASQKYHTEINNQIDILESMINGANTYVFNQNVLLIETDGVFRYFMAIISPNIDSSFKDILQEENKIIFKSPQLQLGLATPVRAFSWITKYLLTSSLVNTPPILRVLEVPSDKIEQIKEFQKKATSEAFKVKENENNAMNEDFKVPNQYGIKSDSKYMIPFKESGSLVSYMEKEHMPSKMQENAGKILSMESFKKLIGFARVKNGIDVATDIHLLDSSHTAFHTISENQHINLYSPKDARENLDKFKDFMDCLIAYYGEDKIVSAMRTHNPLDGSLILPENPTLSEEKVIPKIIELLEVNHCVPSNSDRNLNGNKIEILKREQNFSGSHIKELTQEDLNFLIKLTEDRYLLKLVFSTNKYIKKIKNLKKIILQSAGLYNEFEILELKPFELGNPQQNKHKKQISSDISNIPQEEAKLLFNNLREKSNTEDPEIKLHIIALCFKLLRLIKENVSTVTTNPSEESDYKSIKQKLFSTRKEGNYFSKLNSTFFNTSIPYDRLTSTNNFIPTDGKPKIENIPFIGGISGTTKDITTDLLNKNFLKTENEYWKFQLINASFMIKYNYHSFSEVIVQAALTYKTLFEGNDTITIADKIIEYYKMHDEEYLNNADIIKEITDIVNP